MSETERYAAACKVTIMSIITNSFGGLVMRVAAKLGSNYIGGKTDKICYYVWRLNASTDCLCDSVERLLRRLRKSCGKKRTDATLGSGRLRCWQYVVTEKNDP